MHWADEGRVYEAVSDLPPPELDAFSVAFRRAAAVEREGPNRKFWARRCNCAICLEVLNVLRGGAPQTDHAASDLQINFIQMPAEAQFAHASLKARFRQVPRLTIS